MTDLVGSTAMAERLGKAAAEELRAEHFGLLRGALERSGGREVKNLGDGLMTVFDSAIQSLACAVQMQQAIEARNRRAEEQLGVRIGVSLGDTTVKEGDYFGWPAVEATRLCAAAEGGQIVVNALVRQVAGASEDDRFRSLGSLELKGISEPVRAFELQWEPILAAGIALPERLRELPATAYVGRVAERERLTELWAQAREGSLRLALIGGEAGVGKTRLATHLAIEAHGEGATVLYGRCDEDLGVPYQPWVQALGYLVKEAPRLILDEHVERYGGELARLIPDLRDRMPELPSPRESDPETERYLLYAAVAGLLEGAGEQEPLLLILDDLHWADAPTLSLLRHMVTAGVSMRVLVVGAYRDSELSQDHPLAVLLADLHREQGVERIKLMGLDAEDVLALMEAAAGHELDEGGRELAREITRETAGNPFFAGELLRHLTESGTIVQREGGRWHLAGDLAKLGLPQSVREVIGRRVGRLGPEARTALSAAAVMTQTIAGHIYRCENGVLITTEVTGGTLAVTAGPTTIPTQANPLGPTNVPSGSYTMTATAPPGYQLTGCAGACPTPPTQTVTVPPGGAGVGLFCAEKVNQTIAGHIYSCQGGVPTTNEVPGGTLAVTAGPTTVPTQSNPLGPISVPAGTYNMAATAPASYELVACNGVSNNPNQSVTVPPGGAGVGIFYVAAITQPHIYLGYANTASNNHGTITEHPTPWKGENGVTFVGCGFTGIDECPMSNGVDVYDAGAIRIDAPASEGLNVSGASVRIGPCSYAPWPGLNRNIPAGGLLILTQTAKKPQCTTTSTAEQDNFDTSESFLKSRQYQRFLSTGKCANDRYTPEITLTINGQTTRLKDRGQVLNTGGIDPDICHGASEFRNWRQIQ
jgi:hypothetical protein